jgi:hypothetical protein
MSRCSRAARCRRSGCGGALSTGDAEAADVCISQAAKDALSTCPGGKLEQSAGKKPQVSFKSAPTQVNLKKRDDLTKPTNPTGTMAAASRDERRQRLAARARAAPGHRDPGPRVAVQGHQEVGPTTQARSTPRRRLRRARVGGLPRQDGSRDQAASSRRATPRPPTCKKSRGREGRQDPRRRAQERDLKYYTTLNNESPEVVPNPNVDGEEHGLRRRGALLPRLRVRAGEQARRRPQGLPRAHQRGPTSKYIPNAYLAFGELFFNEAQGDPSQVERSPSSRTRRWSSTSRRTTRSSATPTTSSATSTGTSGRESRRPVEAFKKTIDYAEQYAKLPGAAELAKTARKDIIPVYALVG